MVSSNFSLSLQITQFNLFVGPCFSATLSKLLGIGIILGSILVKVPQIVKIWKSKSGEGISLASVALDLFAILVSQSYSFVNAFPFSAWGDTVSLGIQTVIIGCLVFWFNGQQTKSLLFFAIYLTAAYIMMGGIMPLKVLWFMQSGIILIIIISKFIQILENYRAGSTGQLSVITFLMLFLGSLARIFTSVQETGDSIIIFTYIVSSTMNGLLVLQLLYYWNVAPKKKTQ